jgi:hypothetical protein
MDTDPRYPVSLATAGTVVVRVLIANPVIANALGTLLSNLLGVGDPDTRTPARSWPAVRSEPPFPTRPTFWDDDWNDAD